jgi:DNA-binding SARP family transcriptional activator
VTPGPGVLRWSQVRPQGRVEWNFRVLGFIQVVADGQALDLGGTRERALLACLLLSPNQVVSVDRLSDDLWGERLPETAVPTLRVFISRLRKALRQAAGDEVILTQPPGYLARSPPYST